MIESSRRLNHRWDIPIDSQAAKRGDQSSVPLHATANRCYMFSELFTHATRWRPFEALTCNVPSSVLSRKSRHFTVGTKHKSILADADACARLTEADAKKIYDCTRLLCPMIFLQKSEWSIYFHTITGLRIENSVCFKSVISIFLVVIGSHFDVFDSHLFLSSLRVNIGLVTNVSLF
jgi:hypothetical protein